ncbi:MAG: hypothetical protein OEY89_09870, partial [Gammaproteobacteria bacterium]|nr:hypothetical protein [Gammaproteobacteria bacterium]
SQEEGERMQLSLCFYWVVNMGVLFIVTNGRFTIQDLTPCVDPMCHCYSDQKYEYVTRHTPNAGFFAHLS